MLGTQFNVKSDPAYNALNVNEGRVRVTRLVDGKVADVPARHRVVASINESSELAATQPPEPVEQWKSKLPEGAIYGKWMAGENAIEGSLRSRPLFQKETRWSPLLLYVAAVSVSSGDTAPVLLGPNARFRIRGRMPASGEIGFGITTHFPNGGCSGKYSTLRRVEIAGPAARTFDLTLHLNELRPEEERSPRSAAGLTIEDCWALTIHADKELELLDVELLPE